MKDILVSLHSLHSKKEKRKNEGKQRENEIRIDVADGGGVGSQPRHSKTSEV